MFSSTNETFAVIFEFKYEMEKMDPFGGVYQNQNVNIFCAILYILGLLSCVGLGSVIWFERSGQAGPYRTLINQLVSHKLEQTILMYILGFTVPVLRLFLGPLPLGVCQFSHFGIIFPGINFLLISVSITGIKFLLVVIYKSMPMMDDKILAKIIVRSITFWSFFACLAKIFVEERISTDVVSFIIHYVLSDIRKYKI